MSDAAVGLFRYRALSGDGAVRHGEVEASSLRDALRALRSQGLIAVRLAPGSRWSRGRARLSARDLALGLRVLADVLESGLPMHRALELFPELAPPSWLPAIPAIRSSVRQGHSLAGALARAPVAIPPIVISMAAAGEAGAGIATAIRRAADHTARVARTRAAIRSALAYPIVVAVAGLISIGVMIGVVLPRFAAILGDLGQLLPPTTRVVLAVGSVAERSMLPALLLVVTAVVVLQAWRATPAGLQRTDAFLLRVPFLGSIRMAGATSRFSESLATLLESGVTIQAALRHAARTCADGEIERRARAAQEEIAAGAALGRALATHRVLTPAALRLLRAGEESGRLVSLLRHAARVEQDRADEIVQRAVRALEPVLIVTFAALVGVIAAAMLQAVYAVRPL